MRIALRTLLALTILSGSVATASAQPIQFLFATTSGTFSNSFSINGVGNFVDIDVYLNDTGAASPFFPNTSTTQNLNLNHLVGVGFRLTSATPTVARVAVSSDITPNVDSATVLPGQTAVRFNTLISRGANAGAGVASLEEQVLGGIGVTANNTGRVLLGTFRFTAAGVGSTLLSFADNNTGFAATSLGNVNLPAQNGGLVLDPVSATPIPPTLFAATATITVSSVPEPASLTLCGLSAMGFAIVRRRRSA